MASAQYKILRQQDLDEEGKESLNSPFQQPRPMVMVAYTWLVVLLFISLFLNTIWVYQQLHTSSKNVREVPTLYAGLIRNMPVQFTVDSIYASSNRTIEDEAWKSPNMIPDTGLVALSDDWVRSKNLPTAQRFPWDESKGIYLLNGFHNMHCLHILRKSILEAFDGQDQMEPREHVTHCLDIFREVVMCDADDTPRYTGRVNQQAFAEHPTSGIGQTRMCRDWSQLEKWAIEHSACYKAMNLTDGFPPIERYKFCPNGERLWP